MKKHKRLISYILSVALLFCIGISCVGCGNKKLLTYGDFVYSTSYFDDYGHYCRLEKGGHLAVMIEGLSESGKEKEIIVVPEYIDGIRVELLGYNLFWGSSGIWESTKLKKVFFPFAVAFVHDVFLKCENLEKVIVLTPNLTDCKEIYEYAWVDCFLKSDDYTEEYVSNFIDINRTIFRFSNVSYFYNYENAPNDGYYWIDDYDYGSQIEYIPEQPTRDGYTFGGWYKEHECNEAWDFEKDTLPEVQYADTLPPHQSLGNDMRIYQETKLYAKWIKN